MMTNGNVAAFTGEKPVRKHCAHTIKGLTLYMVENILLVS